MSGQTEAAREDARLAGFWIGSGDADMADLERALDAFETAIRASERQRYSELVEAARSAAQLAEDIAAHIDDLGGSGGDTVRTIATDLRAALAAIEHEGGMMDSTRTVNLHGGYVTLTLRGIDPFQMSQEDRAFVTAMVERMEAHERLRAAAIEERAEAERLTGEG